MHQEGGRQVNVVIACDSFKGSLSAEAVCEAMAEGLAEAVPDVNVTCVPMADGGEGTLGAMVSATGGRTVCVEVCGPLLERRAASYGVLGDGETVVIEVAQAAGLTLVPEPDRNPLRTSTYGVGELIRHALDAGYRKFILGLGGSATNDGGLGMLQALGVRVLDDAGEEVSHTGEGLFRAERVDVRNVDTRLWASELTVASDVDNPLCGSQGATAVFGPQKGVSADLVPVLDRQLGNFARMLEAAVGRCVAAEPGAGAAGGLGFALLALGATVRSGAALVANSVGLEKRLFGADWVITGEGRTDAQTVRGKVPYLVAQLARRYGVKPILVSGGLADGVLGTDGCSAADSGEAQAENWSERLREQFVAVFSIVTRPMSTAEAMGMARLLVRHTARQIGALLASRGGQ